MQEVKRHKNREDKEVKEQKGLRTRMIVVIDLGRFGKVNGSIERICLV